MAKQTSKHILGTAANLLGFCLGATTSIIDEFTAGIALLLSTACICSFLSIRSGSARLANRLEAVADGLFFLALLGIFVIVLLLMLRVLR
ncbi:MAG: hypothetical protein MUF62_11555 [Chitinophagaceae bacterium]|nr:hypothetical protein [Chitinophagaceae bacterium]